MGGSCALWGWLGGISSVNNDVLIPSVLLSGEKLFYPSWFIIFKRVRLALNTG
jgi:hypothetical protein